MRRDAKHYRRLIAYDSGASLGLSLAVSAVYAAKHGHCEAEHYGTDEWRHIERDLRVRYGKSVRAGDVQQEMAKHWRNEPAE